MADFNQFGSVKPGAGSASNGSQHCVQCEAMLADALDGTLSAADQATFDRHMASCVRCADMLADAQRGAAWMEMLKSPRPEPPIALLERILASTSGEAERAANPPIVLGPTDYLRSPNTLLGRPSLVPAAVAGAPVYVTNVLPFRSRVTAGLRSFGHTMLQPRLAMTAAMAFFSIALTLNLTGVRLSELRASDLKPSSILRSCYEAKAKVVRYSDNLRVVYELESRVRDLQRSSDEDGSSTPANAGESDPTTRKPAGNQPDDPKPATQTPDQSPDPKQTRPHPNPGSSRRELPGSDLLLVESARNQAPLSFAKNFIVLTPGPEGGLA